MAKFLTTAGTAYHIEQLIINAQAELVLVTPYLQLSTNFRDRLLDANSKDIDIKLIYGKSELKPKEEELLRSLDNIHIYYLDNLHAKCYYNDSELIIASMNLYAFSERNNREMGILIDSKKDGELYKEALREVTSIINASNLEFKPKNNSTSTVEFDPNFTEKWNFHLPYIYDLISEKYSGFESEFYRDEERVEISQFPSEEFKIVISHTVDLLYDESVQQKIWQGKQKLGTLLSDNRVYWNNGQVNIYPPKYFDPELSNTGIIERTKRQLGIIETLKKFLS